MRILFSHCNFPSQFRRLAPALAQRGHDVVFLARSKEWHATDPTGYRLIVTETHRSGGSEALHPYLRRFEEAVLEGQGVFRSCLKLKAEGWEPDLVIMLDLEMVYIYEMRSLRLVRLVFLSGFITAPTLMLIFCRPD